MIKRIEKSKNKKIKPEKKEQDGVKLAYPEPVDPRRNMLMWIGVFFFSALLVFGWFINARNAFQAVAPTEPIASSTADWAKIGEQMNQAMQELKTGMATVKDAAGQLATTTTSQDISVAATSSDLIDMEQGATLTASELQNSAIVDPADIDDLKIELEKIQTKLK